MNLPVLRVARPTNDIDTLVRFYTQALGFDVVARFEHHEGFDGAIVGRAGYPWQIEFTHQHGVTVARAPSPEHLLVFYLPERPVWAEAVERMLAHGATPCRSVNPYWDRKGVTFEDPDGYRIVLQNAQPG